jgi:hypothetical protein
VSVNRRIFNICKDAFDFAFDEINDLHKYEWGMHSLQILQISKFHFEVTFHSLSTHQGVSRVYYNYTA